MRSIEIERFTFTGCLLKFPISIYAQVLSLATVVSVSGFAQEINHAKFLAQRVALPALDGPDPFTLRESWLNGTMTPGEAKLVPQQLFKKNSYQFWFATADSSVEVFLNIYDGDGKLVSTDTVKFPPRKNVISIVVTPEKSGIYYLRLAITNTEEPQDWALIYAFK